MARKRRRESSVAPEAAPLGARPGKGPWLAVALAAVVVAAAWWGAGALVRRAASGRLPPLADLSALPEPAREQLIQADAVARANPRAADAVGALGLAYHASLMPARAIEEYSRAEKLDPTAWKWPYYRGLLLEERGQQAEAVEAFTRVTTVNPGHGLSWFHIAEIAFKQGRLDEAEPAYLRAEQAPPPPPFVPPGGGARQTIPLGAYAQLGLARIALDRGLDQQAAATLDALVAAHPSFGSARALRMHIDADAHQAPGGTAAVVNAYSPPADPLLDAVVAESRMRDMLLKHSAVAGRGGDDAWRDYLVRRALQFNPRDPNVLMEMASMLRASGRCTEALDYLGQRERLVPADHVTLIEQGRCLSDLGRLEEAEAALRRAARVRDAAAEYNLGSVLDRQGKGEEARTHYERALDIDPFYARAMANLGVWHDRRGQSAEAVTLLQRAVRAAPDNAEIYSNLGSVLIGARRLPEALRALETAVALDHQSPEAHNNLGIALAQSGRFADATREFETALRLDPSHLNARRNLDRLRSMGR